MKNGRGGERRFCHGLLAAPIKKKLFQFITMLEEETVIVIVESYESRPGFIKSKMVLVFQ